MSAITLICVVVGTFAALFRFVADMAYAGDKLAERIHNAGVTDVTNVSNRDASPRPVVGYISWPTGFEATTDPELVGELYKDKDGE